VSDNADHISILTPINKTSFVLDEVSVLKHQIYIIALSLGTLASLAGWGFKYFTKQMDGLEYVIFPVITIYCIILLLIIVSMKRLTNLIEVMLFGGTGLALLVRFYDILFLMARPDFPAMTMAFTDLFYWFPLVYVLAFIIIESQTVVLYGSSGFFVLSLIIGAVYALVNIHNPESLNIIYILIRFYLANLTYIILLAVGIRLNKQYILARIVTERMTYMAHTDHLMNIANRRQLDEAIISFIINARHYGEKLSAIMFDLDHFKRVNDKHGHNVGDAVLREVATLIKSLLRENDLVGRWGGEEFLIIVPNSDFAATKEMAERLRRAVKNHVFEQNLRLTASFGVSGYEEAEPAADWLKRADEALYLSKKKGRNQVNVLP